MLGVRLMTVSRNSLIGGSDLSGQNSQQRWNGAVGTRYMNGTSIIVCRNVTEVSLVLGAVGSASPDVNSEAKESCRSAAIMTLRILELLGDLVVEAFVHLDV